MIQKQFLLFLSLPILFLFSLSHSFSLSAGDSFPPVWENPGAFFSRIASDRAFIAALRASRALAWSMARPTPPTFDAADAAGGKRRAADDAPAPRRRTEEARALRRDVVGAFGTGKGEEEEEEEARTCFFFLREKRERHGRG